MKKLLPFLALLLCCLVSCESTSDDSLVSGDGLRKGSGTGDSQTSEPCLECELFTACTAEYVTISIDIKDAQKRPVVLDHYEVKIKETEEVIYDHGIITSTLFSNYYTLFSDKDKDYLKTGCPKDLEFKGYKDGELVVSETYTVSKDCCHVYLVEGNIDLVI